MVGTEIKFWYEITNQMCDKVWNKCTELTWRCFVKFVQIDRQVGNVRMRKQDTAIIGKGRDKQSSAFSLEFEVSSERKIKLNLNISTNDNCKTMYSISSFWLNIRPLVPSIIIDIEFWYFQSIRNFVKIILNMEIEHHHKIRDKISSFPLYNLN